jgi:hypothetical protein
VVVPLLYDNSKNGLSMPEAKNTPNIVSPSVVQVFKRISEIGMQREDCTLFPAVRELMMNLNVGNDGVLNMAQPVSRWARVVFPVDARVHRI